MIWIQKKREPRELTEYRQLPHASYQDMHGAPTEKTAPDGSPEDVYSVVLDSLMQEQGYICAYCMRRIPESDAKRAVNATIEHISPQSVEPGQALDYRNMLAVCSGNRDAQSNRNKTCDAHRGNTPLYVNPLKPDTLATIQYKRDGTIYSNDARVQHDLNDALNLNSDCDKRRLKENRKKALQALLNYIKRKYPTGNIQAYCKRELECLQNEAVKMEYVGILLYWLKKHAQ